MTLGIVVGTRPQIIKLAALYKVLDRVGLPFFWVHTGQHYDWALSSGLVEELGLPPAAENLGLGSLPFCEQFTVGVARLQPIFRDHSASQIIVIGDSNPARVGAVGAMAYGVPFSHCEAGLRNGAVETLEEQNRLFVDSHAAVHLCSTEEDRTHLIGEDKGPSSVVTGDLLVDAFHEFGGLSAEPAALSVLAPGERVVLFTLHRAENTGDARQVADLLGSLLAESPLRVVWPVHPRLTGLVEDILDLIPPRQKTKLVISGSLTYSELNFVKQRADLIVTDSVGLQVEAYLWRIPCVILRDHIEHHQSIGSFCHGAGASVVLPPRFAAQHMAIGFGLAMSVDWTSVPNNLYGTPGVAERMLEVIFSRVSAIEADARMAAFA